MKGQNILQAVAVPCLSFGPLMALLGSRWHDKMGYSFQVLGVLMLSIGLLSLHGMLVAITQKVSGK